MWKLTLKWVYGVSSRGENFSKNLGTALQIIVIYTKIEMILTSTPIINVERATYGVGLNVGNNILKIFAGTIFPIFRL